MTYESPTPTATISPTALSPDSTQALTWMRNISSVIMGSAIIAVCAHVALPIDFTPVPLTMQDFAVIALGLLLTPRVAMFTMLAYLAAGAAGLPVFAPGGPIGLTGLAHIIGPTGGYMMAYPTAAVVASHLWRTGEKTYLGALVSAGAGMLVLFTLGGVWLGLISHISVQAVIAQGVAPFLPGAGVKMALAAAVGYEWFRMRPAPPRPLAIIQSGLHTDVA